MIYVQNKNQGRFETKPKIWCFFQDKKQFGANLGLEIKFEVFSEEKQKFQAKIGTRPKVQGFSKN